jgi:hypothetical protein
MVESRINNWLGKVFIFAVHALITNPAIIYITRFVQAA